ncbi:glycerol-3-phosphate dehydrogenase [Paraburkholderia sp. MM5384-R2]|nr:glycerol-3-phosphate dehydrogenase [Paraburkholderia sp. MM5384-R2]
MTRYIDFEEYSGAKIDGTAFDLLIVGSGVAGRTILANCRAKACVC